MMADEEGREVITHRDMMVLIRHVIAEVRQELKQQNREDEFVGAKVNSALTFALLMGGEWVQIIYSTLKLDTPEELVWYLEDCIALKKEFPELIVGMVTRLTSDMF
jgi:adenosine deaminase CECR1